MKKILLSSAALLYAYAVSWAVPAYPTKKTAVKSDGTTVEVTLCGDEFFNFWRDANGKALRLDGNRVSSYYTAEEMTELISVGKAEQANANTARKARRKSESGFHTMKGTKKGLVILMQYQDTKFTMDDPETFYKRFFNEKGFSDNGFRGSVSDYFAEQSYGQFNLDFDVVGPFTANHEVEYYSWKNKERSRVLMNEAVNAADDFVDFKDYDWDGDGEVEQIFVIFAGMGANYYGEDYPNVWPHSSVLSSDGVKKDGVTLMTYACSCELYGDGKSVDGIGAACHEFSHCLGYPDTYDVDYGGNNGPLHWDIMCNGSYQDMGRCPVGYTAYERWMGGWLTPTEVTSETRVTGMKPLTESPEAYILYNDGNRNEYYLLENRQKEGFDSCLPGHGLLVFHIDYDEGAWNGNVVNTGDLERMVIIPADNDRSAQSESGDPFPGTGNVVSLTDYTTPAATVHNRNTDRTYFMRKAIECVEEKDGEISMLLCAEPLVAPGTETPIWKDTASVDFSWSAVDGASAYELVLDGVSKTKSPEESLVISEDFAGCYNKSIGFKDVGMELNKYTTNRGFSGSGVYLSPDLLRIGTSTKAGTLTSPVFSATETGYLTIVLQVKPLKSGNKVTGVVTVITENVSFNQEISFNFSDAATLVLHTDTQFFTRYMLRISPETGMSINGFRIYDGIFTEEDLGLVPEAKASRRAKEVKTVTTTDTHYVFNGLRSDFDYTITIRAVNGLRNSPWSEPVAVPANPNGIDAISADIFGTQSGIYDLNGRRVDGHDLQPGVYIQDGRKVMVK